MELVEIAGWIAMVLILLGYGLNSSGKISAQSATYSWINLVGGALFVWNTYVHQAFAPMLLNIIWVIIALVGLIRDKK
jgi:hypothetical protein